MNAIEVQNLIYQYPSNNSQAMQIDDWSVKTGEHIFLYGDSGSGKTTLLNLLCGILRPQTGCVRIFGENLSALTKRKQDVFRARNIGVVFQRFNLITYLSVLKNIQLASYLAKNKTFDIESDVINLLGKLQLTQDILHKQVGELSVGQQQRVAIVRALINKPKLLLVDEPTSALDAGARDAFMTLLMDVCRKQNTSMIFVSHDTYLQGYFSRSLDIASIRANEVSH